MKKAVCSLCLSFFSLMIFAQEQNQKAFHPHHSIGLVISHTNVSKGVQAGGSRKWLSLPSWGINYNYKFSKKWAIGLHNDIVTESFEVEEHLGKGSEKIIERSYPVATAVMASYKPGKHFSYLFGAGGEFSHTGNLFLIRVGAEYGYHLSEQWEFNANITNDLKIKSYNSWAIGMGITMVF